MKKSVMILTLVLAMTISGSVLAAGIKFDGSLKSSRAVQRSEGTIETRPSSELSLNSV